jgi:hypothetical protein
MEVVNQGYYLRNYDYVKDLFMARDSSLQRKCREAYESIHKQIAVIRPSPYTFGRFMERCLKDALEHNRR